MAVEIHDDAVMPKRRLRVDKKAAWCGHLYEEGSKKLGVKCSNSHRGAGDETNRQQLI